MYKLLSQEQKQYVRELRSMYNNKCLVEITNWRYDFEKPFKIFKVENQVINIKLLRDLLKDNNVTSYRYNIIVKTDGNIYTLNDNNRVSGVCSTYYDYKLRYKQDTFYIISQENKYQRKRKEYKQSYERMTIKNNGIYNRLNGQYEVYLSVDQFDKSGYSFDNYKYLHENNLKKMKKKLSIKRFYAKTSEQEINAFYQELENIYNLYKMKVIELVMQDYYINSLSWEYRDLIEFKNRFKRAMDTKTLNENCLDKSIITDFKKSLDRKIEEILKDGKIN